MFGLEHIFCWAPRRRSRERRHSVNGVEEQDSKRRRRGQRRRRHIHAKAGAPVSGPVPTASPEGGSQPVSPLADTLSGAFSESEYHDAVEYHEGELSSFNSRSSLEGETPLDSPQSAHRDGHPHGQQGAQHAAHQQQGEHQQSVINRLATWWESRNAASSAGRAAHGPLGDHVAPRASSARPRSPTVGTPPTPAFSPDELIEPSPDDSKVGCISLFSAASVTLAHKKFLRLGKPRAGSSFRNEAGAEAGPQAPPTPPPAPRRSVPFVGRLLEKLSPRGSGAQPGSPLLKRLLSPRKQRVGEFLSTRKTSEEPDDRVAACWEAPEGTTFLVRSHDYMRTKVKELSAPCIYRLIGVDVYSFDFKIFHIAQHVQLPEVPMLGPAARALPPDQQLPPLLIINLQLPMYGPSLFGSNDGHGHSLVYYFALPEGWEPSHMENQAALGLVQRFIHNKREADGTPTRDRLKLIPRIVNAAEWAEKGPLSGYEHRLLNNYNDRPLLTRPQQRFYTGPNYLEIDLDVHNYAFIARKAFHGFVHRLAPVIFENAFVVQGNRQEELPEQVLAAARVYRVDFSQSRPFPAKSVDELGNGTGPAHDGEPDKR